MRGGYFETLNLDPFVNETFWRCKSLDSCCNIMGQLATLLMVDPPRRGQEFDATVDQFEQEAESITQGLHERAKYMFEEFNKMKNMTCADFDGGANAFPRVHLSQKAIDAAKAEGKHPDLFYCEKLLEATGIVTLPGYGFNEKEGEFHFRATNMINPTPLLIDALEKLRKFNDEFHAKYE